MIIVRVHLLRGRSVEVKHQLLRELTDHVAATLGVDRETVRVFIVEVDPDHWGIAGMPATVMRGSAEIQTPADTV